MWPNGVVIRHQLYRINGSMKSYIAHNDKECINWKIMFIFRRRKNIGWVHKDASWFWILKSFYMIGVFFLFLDCWIWIAINFISKSALVFIAVWLKKQHFFFFTEENLENYSGIHIVKIHDLTYRFYAKISRDSSRNCSQENFLFQPTWRARYYNKTIGNCVIHCLTLISKEIFHQLFKSIPMYM